MATKVVLDFEKPLFELEAKLGEMRQCLRSSTREQSQSETEMLNHDIEALELKVDALRRSIYKNLTRWQKVQLARHPARPYALDYIHLMTKEFLELSGDRHFSDDKAIVGGFACIEESSTGFSQPVMIIGHQKGRDTKSNLYRNFGMAQPEGYRKALRLMKLAEKFRKPVITLIDTPGAFP